MGKGKKDIEIDLNVTAGMSDPQETENALSGAHGVRSRRQILATREKAQNQKPLYVNISSGTSKRLRTYVVLRSGEGNDKLTLSSVTEAALLEYLDLHETK